MVRINCHSAFKHYEMFHNNCGGSNYGSVFNTTYNINCGGHGGGFWGGFGAGLGNAFGSIFGGMFGGGMGNFGFGNFGMGGFGMGGLTMPWFNSMGNFGWGGGNAGSVGNTNNNSGSNSSNGVNDKDNALYNTYKKQVDNAIKDNDAKSAKKLYDKIKKSHENPEDHVYEDMNKGAYHDLMTTLENKFPELKEGTDAAKDKKPEDDGKAKKTTTEKQEVAAPAKPKNDAVAKEAKETKANEKAQNFAGAGSLDDLLKTNYSDLSDAEKEAYKNKAIQLAHEPTTTPEKLREILGQIKDPDLRIAIKESFYKDTETGKEYENVKLEELNNLTPEQLKAKLKNIIDDSNIPDFRDVTLGKPTKSGEKWTIPITAYKDKQGNEHKINVKYKQIDIVDGEILFHGKQDIQIYALQKEKEEKNNNHKYGLMQYKYHEGYGKGDVTGQNT